MRFPFPYNIDFAGVNSVGDAQEMVIGSGDSAIVDVYDAAHGTQQHWPGNVLMILYPNVIRNDGIVLRNVVFRYCHLEEIYAQLGDKVSTSKLLAKRGGTGEGAGYGERPHLHLEASLNADDPFTTPSEPDERRGNYQLIDPICVLNKTQYQTFTLNGEWTDPTTGLYYNFVDEGTAVGDVVI